jgi:hypothetical protein
MDRVRWRNGVAGRRPWYVVLIAVGDTEEALS